MPDNTLSTLEQIRIKIRRLTKTPSTAQMTDAEINSYINTFILYDFPAHLRVFSLRTTLVFYTEPFIDRYMGDDIINNFVNTVSTVYENAYVAGYKQSFSQNREAFFSSYPKVESIRSIGVNGNGVTVNFTGTLSSTPVLRDHVTFTSIDVNGIGLKIYDIPNIPNDGAGTFGGDIGAPGSINYTTGVYDITFIVAPGVNQSIQSNTVPYVAGIPSSILFYDNEITFRPVPDKPYRVEFEVGVRPTELIGDASMPQLSQWWQYIAYGAAKKIFEDRMDMENVALITPEFKKQETLVTRKTIEQQADQRVLTIYSDSSLNENSLKGI